jgi:hypothetical protein
MWRAFNKGYGSTGELGAILHFLDGRKLSVLGSHVRMGRHVMLTRQGCFDIRRMLMLVGAGRARQLMGAHVSVLRLASAAHLKKKSLRDIVSFCKCRWAVSGGVDIRVSLSCSTFCCWDGV